MIGNISSTLEYKPGITTNQVQVAECGVLERARRVRPDANPLERLVQIMHGNDRLMEELETARARIVKARDSLTTPAGNTRFGAQYLAHCKTKHRGILAQLRANRIEANRIMGVDSGEGRPVS